MNSNFAIKRITKLALGHSTAKRSESLERANPKASATKEKKTKHKKGRRLIGTLRQITLLGIKMYHMMSKQIREGLFVPISNSSV